MDLHVWSGAEVVIEIGPLGRGVAFDELGITAAHQIMRTKNILAMTHTCAHTKEERASSAFNYVSALNINRNKGYQNYALYVCEREACMR